MIWFSIIDNAAGAAKYFTPEGRDYHVENERTYAFFGGKAAEKLGLDEFDLTQFKRMLYGQHPTENRKLTVGSKRATNRCGYEVIFDAPKDLSVLWGFGDTRIPGIMDAALRETMDYIEADAKARVRAGGADHDRVTGNLAYAAVLHTTSREENGKVDGHLHYHVLIPNATWDSTEKKWKALQLQEWDRNGDKLDRPRYAAFYHARLAHYMQRLGYELEKTKDAFQVVGFDDAVRDEFCQRTRAVKEKEREIEERLRKEKNDPDYKLSRQAKARLGAIYREPKKPGRSMESLQAHWESRLSRQQLAAVRELIDSASRPVPVHDRSAEAVRYAMEHLTYRKSQIDQREVVLEALRFDPTAVSPAGVMKELGRPGIIRREHDGVTTVTSTKAVNQEKGIIAFAATGRGRCRPYATKRAFPESTAMLPPSLAAQTGLSADDVQRIGSLFDRTPKAGQLLAVHHLLNSPDRVVVWVGKAGSGKSTALRAAKQYLDRAGVTMQVVAPTIGASRDGDLKADFPNVNTVTAFLGSTEMQERLRGGLLVIDEITMLGVQSFAEITKSAADHGYRVLVLGDDKQHLAPVRGDVMGLLRAKANLPAAEIGEIVRQGGKYAEAAEAASRHDVLKALDVIEGMGWVREGPAEQMIDQAADVYMECLHGGETAVVCSPTHRQGEKIVDAVRERLWAENRLKGKDKEFRQLVPQYLSPAQLEEGKKHPDPELVYQWYDAYRPGTIKLAVGDTIRLLGGGKGADGSRLENGAIYTVTAFRGDDIEALSADGKTRRLIGGDFGKFQHAYYTTSLGVQSKTRDVTIMPQTADAYAAMGARQFYVDLTRGRARAVVLTDSRERLRDVIQRTEDRTHAIDLVQRPHHRLRHRLKRYLSFLRHHADRAMSRTYQHEHEAGHALGPGR